MKGLIAGAVGGLIGTLIMTGFQNAMSALSKQQSRSPDEEETGNEDTEPATAKVATAIAKRVLHARPSKRARAMGGQAVHYGFGTGMGAVYGLAAEYQPAATAGRGTAWGTALMIGADEIGVPLAGLGDPPMKTPMSTHLYGLIAHLVYGVACEAVRRRVRSMLE